MLKKAMVLAAGRGTRLGELGVDTPKALVKVAGKPMIEWTLIRLRNEGIEHVLVNVHHHAEQIEQYLQRSHPGLRIDISDERARLLDTGGALLHAKWFFHGTEPVLVHNADILSGVHLGNLEKYHRRNNAMATLCVRKRESGRALLFDREMQLVGWENRSTNSCRWVREPVKAFRRFAFSGIYLVNPAFVDKIALTGRFSIIDAWLEMAQSERIIAYEDLSESWFDLGTPEKLRQAEEALKRMGNLPGNQII